MPPQKPRFNAQSPFDLTRGFMPTGVPSAASPQIPTITGRSIMPLGPDPSNAPGVNGITGNPAFQQQPGRDWGGAASEGLGGLGDYLAEVGAAKQGAQAQTNQLSGGLSNLIQRQGENQISGATSVLGQSQPGYDIDPYAQMALKRAIAGGLPQGATSMNLGGVQAPAGMEQFMPKMTGGIDLSAIKGVMDQYYSDGAIKSSMQQQQELRNNVDPNTPQSTSGLQIFGEGYQPNFGASQAGQGAAQNRQNFNNETSQRVLRDAITGTQKNARGNPLGAILSTVLKAAPMLL